MINISHLKSSVRISSLVTTFGSTLMPFGSNYRCECPIHGGINPSGFAIYNNDSKWTCHSGGCGSGDAIDLVMKVLGISFMQAIEYLGGVHEVSQKELLALAQKREAEAKLALEKAHAEYTKARQDLEDTQIWLAYNKNLQVVPFARKLWRQAGIPDEWQDYWKLGYSADFHYYSQGRHCSPTMTIPIWSANWQIENIRHRILFPVGADKYRPERKRLPTKPFMAFPQIAFNASQIIVCEGEKKAAVVAITLDNPSVQVIGLPGKNQWRSIIHDLIGHDIWICFDPEVFDQKDTQGKTEIDKVVEALTAIHIVALPFKIDDMIIRNDLTKNWLQSVLDHSTYR